MNFSTDKLDLLQKGMKGYNPDVYNLVGEVSSAVSQVALILLGILFVLNLFQMIEKAHKNGGVVEPSVVMSEVLKYMIAFLMIMYSKEILDTILFFSVRIVKIIAHFLDSGVKLEEWKGGKGILGNVFNLLYMIASWVGDIVSQLVIMLRFAQMYLLKAIAPIMVAFFMQDGLRSIAVNFLKTFAGYALQGFLLVVIMIVFPKLITSNIFILSDLGNKFDKFKAPMIVIVQMVLYILTIYGSQRLAKSLMNANG